MPSASQSEWSDTAAMAPLKAGLISASIMTIADVATQFLVEKRQFPGRDDVESSRVVQLYDPSRTGRWAIVGLTLHGPYFFQAFRMLDRHFGSATSISVVAKKTISNQIAVFPPYLVALFAYMGALEPDCHDVPAKVKEYAPRAFVAGCTFWPIANAVNFAFVSSGGRAAYVASAGALWNGYLSFINAREPTATLGALPQ